MDVAGEWREVFASENHQAKRLRGRTRATASSRRSIRFTGRRVRAMQQNHLVSHAELRSHLVAAPRGANAGPSSCGPRRSAGQGLEDDASRRGRYSDTTVTGRWNTPEHGGSPAHSPGRGQAKLCRCRAGWRRSWAAVRVAALTARARRPSHAAQRSGRDSTSSRCARLTSAIFTESGNV